MRVVEYTYQDGDHVRRAGIELPDTARPDFRSCFLFSFPKAGSVLANAVLSSLMAEREIPVVDLPAHLFTAGIDISTVQCDFTELFPAHGYCFAGFRGIPISMARLESVRAGRKILIVRDPRDVLVSLYFSDKFSPPLLEERAERATPQFARYMRGYKKEAEQPIDDYCLNNSWRLNSALFTYSDVLESPDTRVLRYEDFVYDKIHLARSINDWFFLDIPADRLAEIVASHDVIPDIDQPDEHVRQVYPGDYRRKLKPETTVNLDALLGQFLKTFNYEPAFGASPQGLGNSGNDHEAHVKLIVELQENLRKLQEHYAEVNADRQAGRNRIIELQRAINVISADCEARLKAIFDQQSQLGELQAQNDAINADREARLNAIFEQQAHIDNLTAQFSELQAHVGGINADREARLKVILEQQEQLSSLRDQVNKAGAELAVQHKHITELRESLDAANADREMQLQIIRKQQEELARLEKESAAQLEAIKTRDEALQKLAGALDEVSRSRWVQWGAALRLTKLQSLLKRK